MTRSARTLQLIIAALILLSCANRPVTANDDPPPFPKGEIGAALVRISAWREFIFYEPAAGHKRVKFAPEADFTPERARKTLLSIKGTGFLIGGKGLLAASEYVAGIRGAAANFCGLLKQANSRARLGRATAYVEISANEARVHVYLLKLGGVKNGDLCSDSGQVQAEILPTGGVTDIAFDENSNILVARLPPGNPPPGHLTLATDEPAVGSWGFCALPADIPAKSAPPFRISDIIKGDAVPLIEFQGITPVGSSGSPFIGADGKVLGLISYVNPKTGISIAVSSAAIRKLIKERNIAYP